MPIFRSARPYISAYGFQHLMCWLVSWEAGKQAVVTVHLVGCLSVMHDHTTNIKIHQSAKTSYTRIHAHEELMLKS